jgi:hypothetical protein
MTKTTSRISTLAAIVLAATGLAACGGGGSTTAPSTTAAHTSSTTTAQTTSTTSTTIAATPPTSAAIKRIPANALALVGGVPITKAEVNKWMPFLFGGDTFESTHVVAPKGMVSDPPDYGRCIAGVKAIEAKRTVGKVQLPSGGPLVICRELNRDLELQTLGYLIGTQVDLGQSAEKGVHVSDAEVAREFKSLKARLFPKESELQEYLGNHGWTLGVELYLIKRDLLTDDLGKVFTNAGGERAFGKYLRESIPRWTARTICRPGYVVEGCRGYREPATSSGATSPAILLEGLTGVG